MNDELSGFQDWTEAFYEWTDVSVSELHGLMSAIVCALKPPSLEEWQLLLSELSFSQPPQQALELLKDYAEDASYALEDKEDAYEFMPLIPDDEHPIYERLLALKDWAGGFITGIGICDCHLSQEELSLISDLGKIAALRIDEFMTADDADADDLQSDTIGDDFLDKDDDIDFDAPYAEESYLELLEFVRMLPVAFSMRQKRSTKDLALIKGLSAERKTASELTLPPIIDASKKH